MRAACSSSTQNTMVFCMRSPLSFRKSETFLGNDLGAVVKHQRPVKILNVINAVLDFVAVAVRLALLRPVAFNVDVDMDLHHLVRCQEAVADALLQGIGKDRLPEIMDVGDIFGLLRRGGQSYLGSPVKYSRISRQAESSAALPRWHSSMTMRSKKPGENSRKSFCRSSGPVMA